MHCEILHPKYNQENPEILHNYQDNVNMSDVCADITYLLILPLSTEQAAKPKNYDTIPYVITYTQDTTRIKDIIEKYKNQSQVPIKGRVSLTLSSGFQLVEQITMRVLQRSLNRETLNGLVLFSQIDNSSLMNSKQEEDYLNNYSSSDEDQYIDQCCIGDFLEAQKESGLKKDLKFFVEIPLLDGRKQILSMNVSGETLGKEIKQQIINKLKIEFGVNIQQTGIKSLIIKDAKKRDIAVEQQVQINKQHIFENSKVELTLVDNKMPLKRLKTKDYNSYILIFKQGQVEPAKYRYSQISELTFRELYHSKLELIQSKIKRDAIYCLKIMDLLIKPNDKLNIAEKYFKNQSKEPLKVVGKVVNQKEVFYHAIPNISRNIEKFNIDEYIKIPNDQKKMRDQCRQKSKARAQKTKHQYFKLQQRLEPILIYTSNLEYQQQENKKSKIYESLNRFLRDTPFLTLKEENVNKEWRYIYSSFLMKHLQKIPMFKGQTFRGITYDPQAKEGQIITFKQFLSTSLNQKTAKSFAISNNNNKVKHMFVLNIKQGYPIKEYSDFMTEQQILLEPYSDFKVLSVEERMEKVNNKQVLFKIYYLDQIMTSKKLPEIRGNFVVWLDNKPKEGKPKQSQLIFDKISIPQETTIFISLETTAELKNWLFKNQFLLKDVTANLIFITNMGRTEGDKFNQIAGVEALKQIRKYDPLKPVFFYIGDVLKANKKLVDNGIELKSVSVGNTPKEVYSYIIKQISGGK